MAPSIVIGSFALLSGPDGSMLAALGGASLVAPAVCLVIGRLRKWPIITVLPAFAGSVAVLALGTFLTLRPLVVPFLHLAIAIAAPFELLLVTWILFVMFRTARSFARSPTQNAATPANAAASLPAR